MDDDDDDDEQSCVVSGHVNSIERHGRQLLLHLSSIFSESFDVDQQTDVHRLLSSSRPAFGFKGHRPIGAQGLRPPGTETTATSNDRLLLRCGRRSA